MRKVRTESFGVTSTSICGICPDEPLSGACERFPNRTLRWDPKTRTIDNAAANAALHSDYRDGWKVQGLG